MHSFTLPVFMNAFTLVLLFSLVGDVFSAIIAIRPGYLGHHQHNHIRPKIEGYPSMPSSSSRIFTYGKLADKFLMVNDAYLKDGWQSSLEIANAQLDSTLPYAADYHNLPYGHGNYRNGYQHLPNPTVLEVAGNPANSMVPALPNRGCKTAEAGLTSRLSLYISAIRNISLSDIQKNLIRLIHHSFLPGGKTKQKESPFGEEDFSLLIADYLWT